jgi:hypothetical protein
MPEKTTPPSWQAEAAQGLVLNSDSTRQVSPFQETETSATTRRVLLRALAALHRVAGPA